jgi:hypothetical protein
MKDNLLIFAISVMKKWIAIFADLITQRHTIANQHKGAEDNGRHLYQM